MTKPHAECRECGHVYRSGWALRSAYRRRANHVYGKGCWRERMRARFRRARSISFCQECLHDF